MKNNELKIEYISVDKLTPYENNARVHSQKDVNAIKSSIEQFGMCDPIGVWSDKNIIVEGHGRLMALKELGYNNVPCIRLDHLTDEQRKAYTLAHNKTAELSSWDQEILINELLSLNDSFDLTSFGFNSQDVDKTKEVIEDDCDVDLLIPSKPTTQKGDIYQLGNHRLMCGDATNRDDVFKLVGDANVSLIVTDPPYNVGYVGGTSDHLTIMNDRQIDSNFYRFLLDSFTNLFDVVPAGTPFYCWYASSEEFNFSGAYKHSGFKLAEILIWVKSSLVLGRQDYQWRHEPCLYGWKEGTAHYFVDDRSITTVIDDSVKFEDMKKEDLIEILNSYKQTIMYEKKPTVSDLHPTMKPLKLIGNLIKNSSKIGDTVLDVFGGSGSTLMACEQLDRHCCMLELDPRYCDVIVKRWEEFTGNKAIKISK